MIRKNEENESGSSETRRRVKIVVLGILASVLAGAVLFFVFFTVRYEQSPFGRIFGGQKENKDAGKLAYDKASKAFLGVIKSEGYSARRGGEVFYVERAGGLLMEVRKDLVDVREPNK